jgi:glycosyltransferase involved in cell wall biosynthesis
MTNQPKLAYLVSRFPTVTETFILREMIEVEREGLPISLYTLIQDDPDIIHEDAKPWSQRLHIAKYLSVSFITANLIALLTHPLLYLSLIVITIRDLWGCWNFFVRDLFLFPKAVTFARAMQREGITHLHAHWATHTAYTAYIVHRLTGIPYSFTAHAHDIYVRKAMLCRKVEAAKFVATISEFNLRELAADCGEGVRNKIYVVRCGVPVERFTPQHVPTDAPFTILTVAGLRDYKGHPDAIQACKLIKDRLPGFRWWVIGGGPDRAALEALIAEMGVGDVFHLLGAKPEHEVRQFMEQADLFVMSSIILPDRRMDGIPVALMEALAMEIPTVATDVSGIPELVKDNVTGRLVPERRPELLADAIVDLYTHRAKARQLAQAGRELIQSEFTLHGNGEILVHLFKS